MLLIAAAAIAVSTPEPAHVNVTATAQATATIRVVSAVRLSFGTNQHDQDVPAPRSTIIHVVDAAPQPARLFEFQ